MKGGSNWTPPPEKTTFKKPSALLRLRSQNFFLLYENSFTENNQMQVQGITFMNTEWNRWRNLWRNRFVITWHKKVCSTTLQSLRSFLFTVVSFETWQIYHFQPLQYLILPDKNICMTYSWINFYIFLVSKFQKVVILRSKNALNFCLEKLYRKCDIGTSWRLS